MNLRFLLLGLVLVAGACSLQGQTYTESWLWGKSVKATATPAVVAFVTSSHSHASTCATSNATTAITQPSANNLIVLYIVSSTTGSLGLPAGFTQEDTQTNSAHLLEGYKIATGAGETSFTFTDTIANGFCDSWVLVAKNENTVSPFDKHTVNLSTLTGTAGPFTTNSTTSTVNDLPVALLNTGTASQTVSSKLPATLTDLGDSGSFSNHLMYDNAVVSAGAYSASMTMTTTNAFAHQLEVLDLISPAQAGGGGGNGPTNCTGCYYYQGVQIYNGTAGTPDGVTNADIATAPTDTNSTTVLNAVGASITFGSSDDANLLQVNLASTNTTKLAVGNISGGHNPPFQSGTYGGGAGQTEPWLSSFVIEGTAGQTCTATTKSGDCHGEVLVNSGSGGNLNYDYECYQQGFTAPSTLNGYACILQNLNASFTANSSNRTDTPQVAGIPLIGFSDLGEDSALTAINHPISIIIPTSTLISGNSSVGYAQGANGGGTCSGVTTCLELGDILELTGPASSFSGVTGCTNAQSVLVLNQIYNFGAVVSDTGSTPAFRFGLNASGTDPWSSNVFTCLHNIAVNTTNYRIISRTYF